MQQLKLAENENRRDVLAQECRDLLDQAEQIKHASRCPPFGNAMGGVASLTARKVGLGSSSKKPEARRALTTREKIILLEGSRLHGFVFPPWTSPPSRSEFKLGVGESLFLYVFVENPPLFTTLIRVETTLSFSSLVCKKQYSLDGSGLPKHSLYHVSNSQRFSQTHTPRWWVKVGLILYKMSLRTVP